MSVHSRRKFTLQLASRRSLELDEKTLIMGVLNVTPDSFSDGGKFADAESALRQAQHLIASGADMLDIGGESTRPFSDPAPLDVELERVIPLIQKIREVSDIPISVDTTKAEVARMSIQAGADIINDISSLRFDPEMVDVVAETNAPLILMHMQGIPGNMQQNPRYSSLFSEIIAFLEERIQFAMSRGVERSQILVDPGVGFGKTVSHNLQIIRNLEVFHCLDCPLLLGVSRKRFIGAVLDRPVEEREVGTAIVNAFGIAAGAHIVRVHDVAFHKQAALMADALREAFWEE
ncbi:MAG: dihydropteroate synthase [Syntrophobacteraceae bacterium]